MSESVVPEVAIQVSHSLHPMDTPKEIYLQGPAVFDCIQWLELESLFLMKVPYEDECQGVYSDDVRRKRHRQRLKGIAVLHLYSRMVSG